MTNVLIKYQRNSNICNSHKYYQAPWVSLTKPLKDLRDKNFKSLKKYCRIYKKVQIPALFMDNLDHRSYNGNLSKANYRFNAIPIKIPAQFFTDCNEHKLFSYG